jgi:hypothetical protein
VRAGGIVTIVVIGEVYKDRLDRGLAVDETSDAAGNCLQRRNDDCQHKRLFKATGLANQANGKGEKSRSMNGAAALHCHQRRRTECRRRTAPHHSSEKSWAGECCLFYCSAFSHFFLVRNHHSITESGLIFHAFLNLSLIIKENDHSALEAWVRAKKITELHLGRRVDFIDIGSLFRLMSHHMYKGKHN